MPLERTDLGPPLFAFQIFAVLSLPAVATRDPSGLNDAEARARFVRGLRA